MFGIIFNIVMIIVGSIIGGIFKKGIKDEYQNILMQVMGFVVVVLGINVIIQYLFDSKYFIFFIVSLVFGGLFGQSINLELWFNKLVNKFFKSNLVEGLLIVILLFCIGLLLILGFVEVVLNENYMYFLINGMLDGIIFIVFVLIFGFGIVVVVIVLFVWQGFIYLFVKVMESVINIDFINEIIIVGGIFIFSLGLSILGIKKFKILNLLFFLLILFVVVYVIYVFGLWF